MQAVITYSEPAYFYDTNEFCCIVGSNVLVNAFEGVLASYSIAKDSMLAKKRSVGSSLLTNNFPPLFSCRYYIHRYRGGKVDSRQHWGNAAGAAEI